MPDVDAEKVCYVILKARELEAEDEGVAADASNPADDKFVSVLTEEAFSTVRLEVGAFIDAIRTKTSNASWSRSHGLDVAISRRRNGTPPSRPQARERRILPTSTSLPGIPLLASHLKSGLDEFDESCDGYASDRQ